MARRNEKILRDALWQALYIGATAGILRNLYERLFS